ncbi:hypothetical protein CIPAW_08G169000 [Carya illinoinensis]|uniref:AAA+ ATPase domain-containing protein n=1 Tax=Carya illinoinensis TaxID=32201 RepID=A0A8T1PXC8_CARIL|nr:hypothetical protein CIPAW_08G169000 [Carya illinoinensis]
MAVNDEEIEDDVKTWLTKVNGILHQLATKKLDGGEEEAESRNTNESCLNLKQRHQISRKAKKMVVSYAPSSQNMVPERNEDYMTLGSRMSVMERILKALGDANINKIGVSGLAGVGKSTLMEEIHRQAKKERLFNEVALEKVTDNPNISRIQGEIAYMLNLQFNSNETEIRRANRLRTRLQKGNEILIILDDIWKTLDLNAIGIPSKGCKLLLTSRDQRVLASHMGTEKNFELDILGEEEAWNLFEKMAGDSVKDDLDLRNEAIKVAKACAGLPIALSLRILRDALVQLTRPTPKHDTEIWSPVYSCVELSYKHLGGEDVKSLFLLCARQGYYISYRDLLRYGFGLCLFQGIDTLEEARNRLENLVTDLRDACLLLQSPHSSHKFYMHDVVRHIATIIASNHDQNMFVMRGNGGQKAWLDVDALKKCKALYIHGGDHHIHKYPNKIECPKLRYFHVQIKDRYLKTPNRTAFQGKDKLEDIFFQGMDKLKVLSLRNMQLSSLFPLTNLQTLCLDGCRLGDIHWIGELKTLLILSLAHSDISNLPREIGSLTRLRVIPPNVLSSLVDLEELYMREINVQWEVEGASNEGKNASLAELKKLSHLFTLEVDIPNANNLPKDLFTEKFERYKICIGDIISWETLFKEEAFSRTLKLKSNMNESNCTKIALYELNREDFKKLKHLHIQNNGNIKYIPKLRTPVVAFPILETFVLKDMISLEEICQGNLPLTSFKNLKVLKNITRCNNVGAIFVKEEYRIEDQGDMMLYGRLQTLVLKDLPKLVSFLSTRETNSEGNLHDFQLPLLHHQVHYTLRFPSLRELQLEGLPKIKHVWSKEPQTMFRFQALQDIYVGKCKSLTSLFPAWVLRCLEQLKNIEIYDSGVEEIVAAEEGEAVARTLVFPRFYKGVHIPKWPILKKKKIKICEKGEIFASGLKYLESLIDTNNLIVQVAFPILKRLFMMDLPKIKHDKLEIILQDQVAASSFPNIRELRISHCEKLFHVFPTSILMQRQDQVAVSSFSNIQELDIADCEKLLHVFQSIFLTTTTLIQKIRLRLLRLCRLRMLTHFWKEDSTKPCPLCRNLEFLRLSQCGKLKNLVPSLVSLQNLTVLNISHCHGLINLLTSSTAKTLVQLENMTLIDCKRITEIVTKEDGEEVIVRCCPEMKTLIVRCCPEMKTFCHEVLSTPKLKGVYDASYRGNLERNSHWKHDLNTTTRWLWESNQYDTQWLLRERVGIFPTYKTMNFYL